MDRLTEEFFSHPDNPDIEELVLFDFHFDGRESEKSVTLRALEPAAKDPLMCNRG
jgi:hypothetical protein